MKFECRVTNTVNVNIRLVFPLVNAPVTLTPCLPVQDNAVDFSSIQLNTSVCLFANERYVMLQDILLFWLCSVVRITEQKNSQ